MNNQIRPGGFLGMGPVTKNIILVSAVFYLATILLSARGINLVEILGLHFPGSSVFKIWQPVSHMFMHSPFSIWHIVFNMFVLWMFGAMLEQMWGSKRFLNFFLICGFGAATLHYLFVYFVDLKPVLDSLEFFVEQPGVSAYDALKNSMASNVGLSPSPETEQYIRSLLVAKENGSSSFEIGSQLIEIQEGMKDSILSVPNVIGASGAIAGVFVAFAYLFPNSELYLYFLFPVKAKYLAIGYAVFEIYKTIQHDPGDDIAHMAHLGGMLIGYLLIRFVYNQHPTSFY